MLQVAIVVGGGNIFRGSSWAGSSGLDRSSADYIGYFFCLGFIYCIFISSCNLFSVLGAGWYSFYLVLI